MYTRSNLVTGADLTRVFLHYKILSNQHHNRIKNTTQIHQLKESVDKSESPKSKVKVTLYLARFAFRIRCHL